MKNWQKILLAIFYLYVLQLLWKTNIDMHTHIDGWINPSFVD